MRFIGHLDLLRAWERTLRRAKVPIAYTQGFHPRPRINLGAALPLGFTSECEILDFWLAEPQESEELVGKIGSKLPSGLTVQKVEAIQANEASLQQQIVASEYEVFLDPGPSQAFLDKQVNLLLAAKEVPRERQGKQYDLRPLIESLEFIQSPKDHSLLMRLKAKEGATGRPEEVLLTLGLDLNCARIHRRRLILEKS